MTEFEAFVVLGLCDGYGYESDLAIANQRDANRVALAMHGEGGLCARGLVEYEDGLAVPTVEACEQAITIEARAPHGVLTA